MHHLSDFLRHVDEPSAPLRNAGAVADLLPDDVAAEVLGGNAMRVYAGQPRLSVDVEVVPSPRNKV